MIARCRRSVLLLAAAALLLIGCSQREAFRSGSLGVEIDQKGQVTKLSDLETGRDFFVRGADRSRTGTTGTTGAAGDANDASADAGVAEAFRAATGALLSIRVGGEMISPRRAVVDRDSETIVIDYPSGHVVTVAFAETASHIRFTITEATPEASIDLVTWGPYPTRLQEVIGETIGVVQGEGFAVGIQGLNPKSLGGFPWNENDAMPQIDIFENGDYSDLSAEGKRYVLYRVEAAKPDAFGSTLQVFTRNRNQRRIIPNRGYDRYAAPAFSDGGIIGSSIALFGAPMDSVLDTIGEIELAEGLPHPMIDGVWGKKARTANAAYLIMAFSEADHERVIDVTRRAGLRYLYHPGPFETWGKFRLNPESFPTGPAGLKRVVERAAESDIMVGVHTLSNFLTPNDPYATPIPDPRLARIGETALAAGVDAVATEIPIASAEFYRQDQESYLDASMIGNELVRCPRVSDEAPWKLLDCERGAYGTTASEHARGETVARLDDHAYNVFLTNADLTGEMATNLAYLFNATGLRQISFDGLEGNRSTGMGNYGEILFTNAWYDRLEDDIRGHYIADASRTSHYFWHMYTRMNWGEPWYAGFRESQTEYRLKNQPYFKRNLMPAMLGWFSMRPETSVEDIEWMLARSAGFDAGYGFVTGFEVLESNGDAERILELLGLWEEARMADVFPDSLKVKMQDVANEYHLERSGDEGYVLHPIESVKGAHALRQRQPGEPETTRMQFSREDQAVSVESMSSLSGTSLILSAMGADVSDVALSFDNGTRISVPVRIRDGQKVRIFPDGRGVVHSATWREVAKFTMESPLPVLSAGNHLLEVSSALPGVPEAELKVELRLSGAPVSLPSGDL